MDLWFAPTVSWLREPVAHVKFTDEGHSEVAAIGNPYVPSGHSDTEVPVIQNIGYNHE